MKEKVNVKLEFLRTIILKKKNHNFENCHYPQSDKNDRLTINKAEVETFKYVIIACFK